MITNNKPCLTHLVQFIFLYNISQFIKISYFTFALWPKSVFDQLRSMMDNAHQMHDCTVYTCIIQNCMYVTFVRLKIAVIHNICYCYKINKKNVIFVLKTYFLQDFKLLPHDLSALHPPPPYLPVRFFTSLWCPPSVAAPAPLLPPPLCPPPAAFRPVLERDDDRTKRDLQRIKRAWQRIKRDCGVTIRDRVGLYARSDGHVARPYCIQNVSLARPCCILTVSHARSKSCMRDRSPACETVASRRVPSSSRDGLSRIRAKYSSGQDFETYLARMRDGFSLQCGL